MLFTDGRLQAFEQMMRQPPRRPMNPTGKQKKTQQTDPAQQIKSPAKENRHGDQ
jgi:hypothetical protein